MNNIILRTDSYKPTQFRAYNPEVDRIYSYLESRGGLFKQTVFFGAQAIVKQNLVGRVITKDKKNEAKEMFAQHFGRKDCFNEDGWDYIIDKYDGHLPIKIKAVPEGTKVNVKNVLMTVENTDSKCDWLTNYLESLLLKVWYPTTIATQSNLIRANILEQLKLSGDESSIDFKCHDFGYRGCTTEEHAAYGGAAHLVSFKGTDNLLALDLIKRYYGTPMAGFSIPATEHSCICSFGGPDQEEKAFANFLNSYPEGMIACVSDTYNIYNACENLWGDKFKTQILARNGTLVVRPDSGDFFEVVPKLLNILWSKFGGTINEKGYKVLDPHIRLIQGDGMNPVTIRQLYERLLDLNWSADNLAVGSGGGLLVSGIERDTCKFAIKASAVEINGEWKEIFKNPITDPGKVSKKGRLKLVRQEGAHGTVLTTVSESDPREDVLETIFENGNMVKEWNFEEIRKNALT